MNAPWSHHQPSFPEHNERMRGFRRAHAGLALANAPKRNKLAFLESTPPLVARRIVIGTGGAEFPGGVTDWSALVALPKVASYKLWHN